MSHCHGNGLTGSGHVCGYPLTLNEARHYLATGEMPDNWRERVELFVEFGTCQNCDGRKCMGCIFRDWDHDCNDDCPHCC